MRKRIFISDIHLGALRSPATSRFPYDWLSDTEGNILLSFLQYLHAHESTLDELVINGDFLDTWICPHDEAPPSVNDILSAHPLVVASFNALLARGVSLVFLEGNHDMYLKKAELETFFTPSANLKFYPEFYLNKGVYALHGHEFDPFNKRPALDTGDYRRYPLGYFISRIVATQKALTDSDKKPIFEIIKGVVTAAIDNESLALAIFNAILKKAGLPKNTTFIMPGGTSVTADEVRAVFAGSPVSARIEDLEPDVRTLAENHRDAGNFPDVGLVICGHTHDALVKVLAPSGYAVEDALNLPVYANSGTWIGSDQSPVIAPTYIEVEAEENDLKQINVRRMKWVGGLPVSTNANETFTLPGGEVIWTTPGP
ncbi:MAG: UDP-2,3-diacylglucosamine diphosphatase [Thermodesulfobacteriota bacterium]